MKTYDVFVIGSGMSGMTVANKCASKGLTVGITDELPYGGTCALRGCDPKKVLVGVTKAAEHTRKFQGKGIESAAKIDWKELMAFKESFVQPVPGQMEKGYKKKQISTYHEPARFISKNRLEVGKEIIEADKIVIATGAKSRPLEIPGAEYTLTSTDFLNLQELPDSLLFIGGGYIAFEFAHVAARCGAKVTIVHRGKFPLENFEHDIVKHLVDATKELGVKIVTEIEVNEIRKEGDSYKVIGKHGDHSQEFSAEAVFNSSGRLPGIFDLDLNKAGIDFTKKGVAVNEFLQSTSNPHVFAAGDSADTKGLPLTPVAVMEGHAVASNIIKGNNRKPDYTAIPTVVFTVPTMASVGMTEQQANEKGMDVRVNYSLASGWFNAKSLNESYYAYKVIIEKDSGSILGAHLLSPVADETINLFALAIRSGYKASDLQSMVYSYPTFASDLTYMV